MTGPRPTRGEIWWVSLDPTVGSEIRKTRPVVVVSSPIFDALQTRIVVPLTSWQPRFARQANKVRVPQSIGTGLSNESAADVLQVRAVSLQRFVGRLGSVDADKLAEVIAGLVVAVDYEP